MSYVCTDQGSMCVLRDCAALLQGSVLTPGTVVPSMCVYGGAPARLVGRLPEGFNEDIEAECRSYYREFVA